MKSITSLFPLLAALSLSSCVVPDDYHYGPAFTAGHSGYGTYTALPPGFSGEAYYFGGRYYSGGRYEQGRFNYGGRYYQDRYYHNGQYIYGGRHEHHGHGNAPYRRNDLTEDHRYPSGGSPPSSGQWHRSGEQFRIRPQQ